MRCLLGDDGADLYDQHAFGLTPANLDFAVRLPKRFSIDQLSTDVEVFIDSNDQELTEISRHVDFNGVGSRCLNGNVPRVLYIGAIAVWQAVRISRVLEE